MLALNSDSKVNLCSIWESDESSDLLSIAAFVIVISSILIKSILNLELLLIAEMSVYEY